MSPARSPHASVVEEFWRFFSRHTGGGDIMKYAYLAPGDRFGAATQNPEYYITGDELRTLDDQVPWLASLLSAWCQPQTEGLDRSLGAGRMHVVEWGPGPGHIVQRKTLPLLKALTNGSCPPSYEAVDVSAAYARDAADVVEHGLAGAGASMAAQATEADFMAHAEQQASKGTGRPTCMFFWGVTFGNFDGAERERLIAAIKSYDSACFTVDHNLDLSSLSKAYDNAHTHSLILGALEYFQSIVEEDALVSVSGFDLSAWEPEVCFEAQHRDASGAVDELIVAGNVRSRRDHTMVFGGLGLDRHEVVQIAAGERFRVLQSRKYSEGRLRELFDRVPSEQPKQVVASGVFGEGSRIGLVVVSGNASTAGRDMNRHAKQIPGTPHTTGCTHSRLERALVTAVVIWALLIDYCLLTMLVPIVPFIQGELDASPFTMGALLAAKPLVQLLADPMIAPLADRQHVWPLLVGLGLEAATALGFAFCTDFVSLMASRGLQGVASAMIMNAGMSVVARAFADDDTTRGLVMSFTAVGITVGAALGPVLSSMLFSLAGMKFTFVVSACMAGVVLVISTPIILCHQRLQQARSLQASSTLGSGDQDCEGSKMASEQSMTQGFRRILGDDHMRIAYLSIFTCNVTYSTLEAVLGTWMEKDLGQPATSVGHVFLGLTLPLLVLFPLSGWLGNRVGRARAIFAGLGLMGVASAILPVTGGREWATALILCVFGAGIAGVDGCAPALLAELVDRRHESSLYGSAFALRGMAASAGFILGPVGGSVLSDHTSFTMTMLVAGSLACCCAPLVFALHAGPPAECKSSGVEDGASADQQEAKDASGVDLEQPGKDLEEGGRSPWQVESRFVTCGA